MTDTARVRAHYDAFPYPVVHTLGMPLPVAHRRMRLSFLLRRRQNDVLPAGMKIWIAGCGTQQGAYWGMSFPDAEVVATDLSSEVLDKAKGLADAVGVRNVRFEQGDLMEHRYDQAFDFVVSTGVMHHLPSPATGVRHLRDAMKPGGAGLFMVYSSIHRGPLALVREAVEQLSTPEDNDDARYELACHILEQLLASETTGQPSKELLQLMWDRRQDRPYVADAIIHPLEHTYDVDGLMQLLDEAGLAHRGWYQPGLWRLEEFVDSEVLARRMQALDPRAQWNVIYRMAGLAAPLFEVMIERKEDAARPPYAEEELVVMPALGCHGARVVKVDDEGVKLGEGPAYYLEGDEVVGNPAAGYGSPRAWRMPAYAKPLLDACDGRRTIGDVVKEFAPEFGAQECMAIFKTLLPYDMSLVVPGWG